MTYGKVMVVDDEPDIVRLVKSSLEKDGFEVVAALDGETALDLVTTEHPDVIVLDIMLPKMDGLTLCQTIRKSESVPILMLSARGEDIDKILGLEIGADDYLTKPFNPKELSARVRAMIRRVKMLSAAAAAAGSEDEEVIASHNIKIYPSGQRVELGGKEVRLTPIEFSLLKVLVAHAGRSMTRQDLLNRVWGPDFFGDERTVDAHIRNLRIKLQAVDPTSQYITSVWRVGYKFEV